MKKNLMVVLSSIMLFTNPVILSAETVATTRTNFEPTATAAIEPTGATAVPTNIILLLVFVLVFVIGIAILNSRAVER